VSLFQLVRFKFRTIFFEPRWVMVYQISRDVPHFSCVLYTILRETIFKMCIVCTNFIIQYKKFERVTYIHLNTTLNSIFHKTSQNIKCIKHKTYKTFVRTKIVYECNTFVWSVVIIKHSTTIVVVELVEFQIGLDNGNLWTYK
jgi:hypothetical protein